MIFGENHVGALPPVLRTPPEVFGTKRRGASNVVLTGEHIKTLLVEVVQDVDEDPILG